MSLFGAAELADMTLSGGGGITTASDKYDSTRFRYGFHPGYESTDFVSVAKDFGPYTTFWHGFEHYIGNQGTTNRLLVRYYGAGDTNIFRLIVSSTYYLQPEIWDGTTWVAVGDALTFPGDTRTRYDIKIVVNGGTISFELYMGGTIQRSGSLSSSETGGVSEIRLFNTTNTALYSSFYCENVWGNESTIGCRYYQVHPTANGTDVAGTGTFADVDESGVPNDGDAVTVTNAGDAKTFTGAALSLPSGTIKAVVVHMRVKRAVTGAQNVKARLRLSGVAYDSALTYAGIGEGFTPFSAYWTTNPAGGAWTKATVDSATRQFGLVAAA